MKKKLIASCRVRPYTSGAAIDRQNFGSAVLGLKVAAATGSPTAAAPSASRAAPPRRRPLPTRSPWAILRRSRWSKP